MKKKSFTPDYTSSVSADEPKNAFSSVENKSTFAFDDNPENEYLPQYYNENCVAYTGTHDNDT